MELPLAVGAVGGGLLLHRAQGRRPVLLLRDLPEPLETRRGETNKKQTNKQTNKQQTKE